MVGRQGCSTEDLSRTKTAYEEFLGDAKNLEHVRGLAAEAGLTPDQRRTLAIMEKTFKAYTIEDPRAAGIKVRAVKIRHSCYGSRLASKVELC